MTWFYPHYMETDENCHHISNLARLCDCIGGGRIAAALVTEVIVTPETTSDPNSRLLLNLGHNHSGGREKWSESKCAQNLSDCQVMSGLRMIEGATDVSKHVEHLYIGLESIKIMINDAFVGSLSSFGALRPPLLRT